MSEAGEGVIVEARTDKEEYAVGEPVRMTLRISNVGALPVNLMFTSGQRYDFITRKDDQEIWRWSQDKVFAQVIGSLTLNRGERRVYSTSWIAAGSLGNYHLAGVIASHPQHEACCTFKLVGRG